MNLFFKNNCWCQGYAVSSPDITKHMNCSYSACSVADYLHCPRAGNFLKQTFLHYSIHGRGQQPCYTLLRPHEGTSLKCVFVLWLSILPKPIVKERFIFWNLDVPIWMAPIVGHCCPFWKEGLSISRCWAPYRFVGRCRARCDYSWASALEFAAFGDIYISTSFHQKLKLLRASPILRPSIVWAKRKVTISQIEIWSGQGY